MSPILEANLLVEPDPQVNRRVQSGLDAVLSRQDAHTGFIHGMGFQGKDHAPTHTIAYTLQGLLEAREHLGEGGARYGSAAERGLARLFQIAEVRKTLPGALSAGWTQDRRFACVTGNCQVALCFLALWQRNGDPRYLNAACRLHMWVSRRQRVSGAVAGSVPLWGQYMGFRWPNWAVKYFLDLTGELRHELITLAKVS